MRDAFPDMTGTLRVDYWIGIQDGLLRRSALEGNLTKLADGQSAVNMAVTVTYGRYGQIAPIEPPELALGAAHG